MGLRRRKFGRLASAEGNFGDLVVTIAAHDPADFYWSEYVLLLVLKAI